MGKKPKVKKIPTPFLQNQTGDMIGRKTLVLDLDETLIKAYFEPRTDADFVVDLKGGEVAYVFKRPHVDTFLMEMAKHFEIVE
jgi:RNA polymerase II subunit A small phosphatase-like protein